MLTEKNHPGPSSIGKVSIYLHANLARFVKGSTKPSIVLIKEGETLVEIISRFEIPASEISFMIVNGNMISDYQIALNPGDEIHFFGIVGGG